MQGREGLVTVVVGGQAGSEAKGAVTGFLAYEDAGSGQAHVGVRIGGSQAGHTVYDLEGRAWPLRHVPVSFVNPDADLVIAAGSDIDLDVLRSEVEELQAAGHKIEHRLWVDPQATLITTVHKLEEASRDLTGRIGSTAKGVGAARAARLLRDASLIADVPDPATVPGHIVDTAALLHARLRSGSHIVIEGVQGYQLGLHAGHYPQCTTSDCRAIDFLAMAGISPWHPQCAGVRVVVVVRVYPIRVAGNSGYLASETSWEALGLEPELTTVTKKVRRVGDWNAEWVSQAVRANGGPGRDVVLAVTMLDQKYPELRDVRPPFADYGSGADGFLAAVDVDSGAAVALVGTGPRTMSVYDSGAWR